MQSSKIRLYMKFIILMLCFIVFIRIVTITISRYESDSSSNADIDIAFYLLKEDYQSMTLNLGQIVPKEEPYIYQFEITNEENGRVAETDLEYSLDIRTTTNLPLQYRLYRNEKNIGNAKSIVISDTNQKDEDGTYFRILGTENQIFTHSVPKSDIYTLVVEFPIEYRTEEYGKKVELVEIRVDSHQIID